MHFPTSIPCMTKTIDGYEIFYFARHLCVVLDKKLIFLIRMNEKEIKSELTKPSDILEMVI